MKTKLLKNLNFIIVFCLLIINTIFFINCSSIASAKQICPYAIAGKCSFPSDTSNYNVLGYDFTFFNTSEKKVSDFTLVFYVYDEDGNSPFSISNCIITNCKYSASPKSEIEGEVSLDEYISEVPDVPYRVENVYISEIRYADGSIWQDKFGFYSF